MKKFYVYIADLCYYILITFFCYTATNKALNLQSFKSNLTKTSLFSTDLIEYLSVAVIVLEFAVIAILLINKVKGLLATSFIMLIFTSYISFLRFKGLYEVCGCGGILNGLNYTSHFLINIFLISISFYSYYISNGKQNEK